MSDLRFLLLPFSVIYWLIIFLRNKFFDWGIFKSQSFDLPVISVGNLEVGGSGKTPTTEYLIQLLAKTYKIATLSRGYGRKTKGFRYVAINDDPLSSGDEPLQMKRKFPEITVAVCEKRVNGIIELQKNHQLIMLDDAYQHRAVKAGLSILLFDYQTFRNPKYLLPAGNYRESFEGKKRANILVITKAPEDLPQNEQDLMIRKLEPSKHQEVYFSYISYSERIFNIFNNISCEIEVLKDTEVLLLTGIAKPQILLKEVKKYTNKVRHHSYPDHHQFSQKNMLKLVADFNEIKHPNKIIITTEKDAVRLKGDEFKKLIGEFPIYAWPIKMAFHNNEAAKFDAKIIEYVNIAQRIN